jgi:hypothetical protein
MDDPLMHCTPGITKPALTAELLGTEGEMTPGPDEMNPYRSPEERAAVEETMQRQQTPTRSEPPDSELLDTVGVTPMGHPTRGDDPYVFDDASEEVDRLQLPILAVDQPEPFW